MRDLSDTFEGKVRVTYCSVWAAGAEAVAIFKDLPSKKTQPVSGFDVRWAVEDVKETLAPGIKVKSLAHTYPTVGLCCLCGGP